jgi:sulfur carrier protein
MLKITINGQVATQAAGTYVDAIIANMQLVGKRYAVERNGEIIPKSRLSETPIVDGDKFEIVIAVGGG